MSQNAIRCTKTQGYVQRNYQNHLLHFFPLHLHNILYTKNVCCRICISSLRVFHRLLVCFFLSETPHIRQPIFLVVLPHTYVYGLMHELLLSLLLSNYLILLELLLFLFLIHHILPFFCISV